MISILGDEESVISAITVESTGYLLKDAFPTNVAATVRDLVAGPSPISARSPVSSCAERRARRKAGRAALSTAKLVPREIDILWGIAKASATPRLPAILAFRAGPSPATSEHLPQLEVHTRGEAVFEAVQRGLIRL